jgi:beta-glucanase (GH16 family)
MTATEPPSILSTPALPRRSKTLACLGLLLMSSIAGHAQQPKAATSQWQLSWSDEFNGPNGSSPDPAKWSFDIGGSGYGNNELESYTNRPANVQQKNGNLVITALKEDYTGPDGLRHYTSGRIRTQGHFSQAYGRFEASIQLPLGKGIWPAFWLLGDDVATAGWPRCGEIDILETIGAPSTMYSTLHGPGYSGANGISAKYQLPAGEAVNTGFHIYAVEWAPNDIKFYLDDHLIVERSPTNLPPGTTWVYDHPFFIILNLATGGNWPGNPDETTAFPQQMLVNYMRVYTRNSAQLLPAAGESHQKNQ